jgi:putative ABC transport system permease protein
MRLPRFLRRARRDAELARDLQFYLDCETKENIDRGMAPGEAQAAARRKLGNATLIREDVYRMKRIEIFETFWQDLSYAFRVLRHRPAFTATVLVTLALGIGGNTAVFSIMRGVLLEPLPYKEPSRLVVIWDRNLRDTGVSKNFDSFEDFRELEDHAKSFEQVAAATWAVNGRILERNGSTQEVLAEPVSESFFPLLGISPALGRTFVSDDLKRSCSVVLSDRLWRGFLGGDAGVVGKHVTLDDQPCSVVGVMPPGFAFYPDAASLWVLLTPNFSPPPDRISVGIFARLRSGVSLDQAQAEVTALHAAAHRSDGKERDIVPVVYDLHQEFTFLAEVGLRTTLLVLTGAVAFVLLIVCLNVANLLLGQAAGRGHEYAMRAALGGGRLRLMRQVLTEGLLLATAGGALGIGVAFLAIRYFRALNPVELPVGTQVEISWPVPAFAGAVSVLTALLFGLLPAWRASRLDAIEAIKGGGRGSVSAAPQRLAHTLIAAEMALSLMLLAGAGLLMQSVLKMDDEPLGFRPEGLTVTSLTLPPRYYLDSQIRLQFFDKLIDRLGNQPVALSTALPPYGAGSSVMHIANQPVSPESERHDVGERTVTPGYFGVLGVQLLRGRMFDAHDGASSLPVAMINDAVAHEYFSGANPIGQRIRVGDSGENNPWRVVVGVVSDEKISRNYRQIGWTEHGAVFEPLAQDPPRRVSIVVRGPQPGVRDIVADIGPGVAVGDTETMESRLSRLTTYSWFRALLLGGFAAFSLLVAAIGLYGVLSQFVAQRTREIGVRITVGARPGDVVRLLVLQAGRPLLAGLTAGLLGVWATGRYLGSLLYDVRPTSPPTLIAVSVSLVAAAALATAFTARRAVRIDPLEALRND